MLGADKENERPNFKYTKLIIDSSFKGIDKQFMSKSFEIKPPNMSKPSSKKRSILDLEEDNIKIESACKPKRILKIEEAKIP